MALHPIMAQALAPFAPADSSVHAQADSTLHREINALGGVPANDYDRGHNDAIGAVLAILERRGFTEANDAAAPVTYHGYVIRPHHDLGPAYYWQHKDFDGPGDDRYGYANSEAEARELIDEQFAMEAF